MVSTVRHALFTLAVTAGLSASGLGATDAQARGAHAQSGVASWYGPGFQGRRTANGERFNTHAMTAAHRTLPFGTRVRVTNRTNGRSVVVRINDRGPFVGGRVIDLSNASARALGVSGTARVSLARL
ncbi:septal ring lytic transglycosylase RlpA family protein [Methylobacterium durans]|uniref:septal ring lytic transglycosylase RlpA family protein n=1 Tax=Methylobacterium durans TaxID=2202825 RepID=UPI002AFE231D|nr:septal ring lytic transglycosylase RlpA family protein [Methylobacterium durans]MEA1834648.1 septal ring lytic transglycosylase RlpA family protein [Methylobacterium durans]